MESTLKNVISNLWIIIIHLYLWWFNSSCCHSSLLSFGWWSSTLQSFKDLGSLSIESLTKPVGIFEVPGSIFLSSVKVRETVDSIPVPDWIFVKLCHNFPYWMTRWMRHTRFKSFFEPLQVYCLSWLKSYTW